MFKTRLPFDRLVIVSWSVVAVVALVACVTLVSAFGLVKTAFFTDSGAKRSNPIDTESLQKAVELLAPEE